MEGFCFRADCLSNVAHTTILRDCLVKMNKLTKKLESRLGPDTGDLKLRVGLHSGAVTVRLYW